jgi:hypothetical protein
MFVAVTDVASAGDENVIWMVAFVCTCVAPAAGAMAVTEKLGGGVELLGSAGAELLEQPVRNARDTKSNEARQTQQDLG